MERFKQLLATAAVILLLIGCHHNPVNPGSGVVEAPKPVIDSRILQLCDVKLTPIGLNPPPDAFFQSHKETVDKLNECACRQLEARNALCSLTSPGCVKLPACPAPKEPTQ